MTSRFHGECHNHGLSGLITQWKARDRGFDSRLGWEIFSSYFRFFPLLYKYSVIYACMPTVDDKIHEYIEFCTVVDREKNCGMRTYRAS